MSRLQQASCVRVSKATRKKVLIGIVLDVVMNAENDIISEEAKRYLIGSAKIRRVDDVTSSPNQLRYYPPHDYTILDLPVIGETVELVNLANGQLQFIEELTTIDLIAGNITNDIDNVLNPIRIPDSGGDYQPHLKQVHQLLQEEVNRNLKMNTLNQLK